MSIELLLLCGAPIIALMIIDGALRLFGYCLKFRPLPVIERCGDIT